MGIIGMIIMWAFAVLAFVVLTRWPMGQEYDRRQKYWARFEGK